MDNSREHAADSAARARQLSVGDDVHGARLRVYDFPCLTVITRDFVRKGVGWAQETERHGRARSATSPSPSTFLFSASTLASSPSVRTHHPRGRVAWERKNGVYIPRYVRKRAAGNRFEVYVTRAIGLSFRLYKRLRLSAESICPANCNFAIRCGATGREAIVEINLYRPLAENTSGADNAHGFWT